MEDIKNNLKDTIETVFAYIDKEIEEECKKHFLKQEKIQELQVSKEEVSVLLEKLSIYIDREREYILELEKLVLGIRLKQGIYNNMTVTDYVVNAINGVY